MRFGLGGFRSSAGDAAAAGTAGCAVSADDFPYRWAWRWRTLGPPTRKVSWFGDGVDRLGRACRVLVRGGMNSALIEFDDGYRVVTSRAGLRRRRPGAQDGRRSDDQTEFLG